MAFSRPVDQFLDHWLSQRPTEPLLLEGSMGSGRSEALRRLSQRRPDCLTLDLSRRPDRELVRGAADPGALLEQAARRVGLEAPDRGQALLLDEVHEQPDLLAWLPDLARRLPVVASGWPLESPSPGARHRLEPLSFLEYLEAVGEGQLAGALREDFPDPVPAERHERALELFREHLLVGGLPGAVAAWVETRDLTGVRRVHRAAEQAGLEALARQVPPRHRDLLEWIHSRAPEVTGDRFKRRQLAPGVPDRTVARALQRLTAARLLSTVAPTSDAREPLRVRPGAAHRLLPADLGLACTRWGLSADDLDDRTLMTCLGGRLARSAVGVGLRSAHPDRSPELRLWVRESRARSTACVDHLVARPAGVVPVVVRAGAPGALKALHRFLDGAEVDLGIRLDTRPGELQELTVALGDGRRLAYRLLSVPLYLAELLA